MTIEEIRERYGESGITSMEPAAEDQHMSAYMAMLAVSLDGRVRLERALASGLDPIAELRATYELWSSKGEVPWERAGWLGEHLPRHVVGTRVQDLLAAGLGGEPTVLPEVLCAALATGLWTLNRREVITHAREAASVLRVSPLGIGVSQAFAVIVSDSVMTGRHVRDFHQVINAEWHEFSCSQWLHRMMRAADGLVRPNPMPEAIVRIGDGSTDFSALAVASFAVQSSQGDFGEALRIAVNHSGESAATGALAGALIGASSDGIDSIPPRWLESLPGSANLVLQVAKDVVSQIGGTPPGHPAWNRRYPLSNEVTTAQVRGQYSDGASSAVSEERSVMDQPEPHPVPPVDAHERFLGSMLGGAMGDALGFAIEFHDIDMIRRHHGESGLSGPVLRDGVAQISDDTQMMLFALEGLIRAHVARRMQPTDNDPVPEVQHAFQRWFHTQGPEWRTAGGPYAQHLQRPDGWLITNPGLFASRAPGNTCMTALSNFAQTGVSATTHNRINNSKGCGGVMRAAPVAVWSNDPAEVFYAAVGTAALTHSHPSGFLSAGVLAVIVHQLIREVPPRDSVRLARELLTRWREHEEQLQILDKAVALAERGPVSPEEIAQELGGGWVGEQALAIGLYAVLATDDLRDALLLSVNHSGDSDSTGIVCGNIGGALYGTRAVPPDWLGTLELRGLVETVAEDALAEFSPGPPTDPAWAQRYPAW